MKENYNFSIGRKFQNIFATFECDESQILLLPQEIL